MTLEELKTKLDTLKLPVSYRQWSIGQAPKLPYLLYYNGVILQQPVSQPNSTVQYSNDNYLKKEIMAHHKLMQRVLWDVLVTR